jgi:L-threonylcarbamoyladenylate synthase
LSVTSINQYTQKSRLVDAAAINAAADLLKAGKLVAFPTETVYGLGGDATNDTAVAKIFEVKGRPQINPLIVHVASHEAAQIFGTFNANAQMLAQSFWPGALTLVVPRTPDCPASLLTTAGLDTIALRVPAHPTAQAILREASMAIAAPSANKSGHVSSTRAEHVVKDLGTLVDFVLDDGPVPIGLESTIIACLNSAPSLLRPGALPRRDIEHILGCPLETSTGDQQHPQAPGQLASHYAPQARLRLNAKNATPGEALLAFGPDEPHGAETVLNLSQTGDLIEAAAHLFEYLRILDGQARAIAVMPIPDRGLGEAINDRLARAAAPRP